MSDIGADVFAEWWLYQSMLFRCLFFRLLVVGGFFLFFPCRYCIYSLSFMKAFTEIAMRPNPTTVCRPPGLPQFARVG